MYKFPRSQEYKALFYRILLAYFFYFIARLLFWIYNSDLIKIDSIADFFTLYYHGLAFDTTAILYINALFIVFSILPFTVNTGKGYQKFLFWVYFATNLVAYATNFIDFIYYKYTFGRSTVTITDSVAHETNKMLLFFNFLANYWHVFLLFFICAFLWIFLYKRVKVKQERTLFFPRYFGFSLIGFLLIAFTLANTSVSETKQ